MTKCLDKDYLKYLLNKKVALVGPASYLLDTKMGSVIDSYDIVVRVGRSLEILGNHPQNLGTKADILYNSCIEEPNQGGDLSVDLFREAGLEWVCTIPHSDFSGNVQDGGFHPSVNLSSIEKIKQNFKFHITEPSICIETNSRVKCRANTGFVAIFDLLSQNIQELFICGYSFYLDPYINDYKKGCTEIEADNVRRTLSTRHIQGNHWQCLKDEVNKNTKVVVDPFLRKILNMESYSLEEFQKLNNV